MMGKLEGPRSAIFSLDELHQAQDYILSTQPVMAKKVLVPLPA